MTGARSKRICRIADSNEFGALVAQLDEYTREAHEGATFHIDRRDLTSVWFATPFAMSRDADALEESNFKVIKADLQRINDEGVDDHHFGHWAVGWFDRLYIRKDDLALLRAVQGWLNALADYPVADDLHYSDLEWERNHPGMYAGECYCDDPDCSVKAEAATEAVRLRVPDDFPVVPVESDGPTVVTCGQCGLSWDDSIVTSWTPAPAARCPFETWHDDVDD